MECLKEKQRAISGLPLTEENYRTATDLLKEHFGKTHEFDHLLHGIISQDRRAIK